MDDGGTSINLSHKKRDAWMHLQNKDPKSDDPTLQQEYKRLCNLTKIAAERPGMPGRESVQQRQRRERGLLNSWVRVDP